VIRFCLLCAAPFEANESLEHLPHGHRFAFDPSRGRLWAVCRHCRRWNLTPIEARWEALEELERLTRDRAKVLAQTDNIALLRAGNIDLVRVGRAERAEEAWWRYGRELTGRRERFRKVSFIGTVAAGTAIAGGWATGAFGWLGAYLIWKHGQGKATASYRWLRFGSVAWRGVAPCLHCGHELRTIRYDQRDRLVFMHDAGHGGLVVGRRCPRCHHSPREGQVLDARAAERVARRVLAYHHFSGASEKRVIAATKAIEAAGSPAGFARAVLGDGRSVNLLERTAAVGLEITANEAAEQRLLEAEVAELDAMWREEEQIAAIADGELTPLPLLEKVRRRVAHVVPAI
jgi:hypothetical protein